MSPRTAALAAILAAAGVIVAAALAAATGGAGGPTTTRAGVPSNAVVLVDQADRVVAASSLGGVPTRLAYGVGAFWVAVPESGFVARVDARTHAVRRFRIGKDPYDVAVGGGAVWIPDHDLGVVFRLDPQTGSVAKTESLDAPVVAVGYGLGAAWAVAAPGNLVRIDQRTLKVTRTTRDVSYAVEGREPKLLFAGRRLVIASPAIASLTRIGPDGDDEGSRLVGEFTSAALAGGDIWITDSASVFRLGGPQRLQVGSVPADLTAAGDSLWVAVRNEARLERVGTDGRLEATIQLDKTPVAVAAGGGLIAAAVTGRRY